MSAPPGLGFRARRLRHRVARFVAGALRTRRTVYVDQRVAEYRAYWEGAARVLGAEFVPLSESLWEVRRAGRRTRVSNYVTECDDPVTLRVAGDKVLCLRLAAEAGVPVPRHVAVSPGDLAPAFRFLAAERGPCVVKPAAATSSGLGVTTGIWDRRRLRDAAALASLFDTRLLVEQMVVGESCRLLYLDGRFLHAVRRRGVRVTGDGVRTIAQLLEPGRAKVARDRLALHTLAVQGMTPASVPRAGVVVVVRGVPAVSRAASELRTVYDESVTDLCAPALAEQLAGVVRGVGSEFAGVDIVCLDLSGPLRPGGGAFLEINTTPGIHHHSVDQADGANPVAEPVLAYLLGLPASAPNGVAAGATSIRSV
jgi:cyanophycin synthetase